MEREELHSRDKNPASRGQDLICGVDRDLVESFLILIRENYKKGDMATFYLEQRSGVVNIQGLSNFRDVLSHLATMLDPNTPEEKKQEQLNNAEEHLRRAVVEPYEIAVNTLVTQFEETYQTYKEQVIPALDTTPTLVTAPRISEIESRLRELSNLMSKGRTAKLQNLWNPEWEQAITSYISAYDKLHSLHTQLEEYVNKYGQLQRSRVSTKLHVLSLLIGVTGVVVALLSILSPSLVESIRRLFSLR